MPKDNENIHQFDPGPLKPTESQAFRADELVKCAACGRNNPPTRSSCLYCGVELAFDESRAIKPRPTLRPLESAESGYNNIIVPTNTSGPAREIASLLDLPEDAAARLLSCKFPLPLARTASHDEATLVASHLNELGIQNFIVTDQQLEMDDHPTTRIRAAELSDDVLLLHQITSANSWKIVWSNLTLLVPARITRKSIVSKEKKAGAGTEILDASETQADESILDIYSADSQLPFRIAANSFDFSCLGARKTLMSVENFNILIQVLLDHAQQAILDDSYKSVRPLLEFVWPSEKRTESTGWRREHVGKVVLGAVTQISNETQFSRYSRLRHFLIEHPEVYET